MSENKSMAPILAIETSGDLCSVALLKDENVYYEINANEKNIHSEILFKLVDNVLAKSGVTLNEVKTLAVSNGPGSFTGLRIGVAAAKGIASGAKLPMVFVPTFEALAMQISNYLPENSKFIIANKVNGAEYYFAKYESGKGNSYSVLDELQIIAAQDLKAKAGDAEKYFGNYQSKGANIISSPRSIFIALWAYYFGKDLLTFNFDLIEPNYLKKLNIKQGVSK
ncbi:MAG: tRNA (adenosine(37)-N6)-threonylcarbamoyltransferase complex dimerization subunit type 1 TsaB [Chlorobi bacterium]|nr:tRNA (adenosine(37)-N6)-threonylcarbamoyltransferase complex dimerization subunit type 1 TsaB [Chlorobiota bacterium]